MDVDSYRVAARYMVIQRTVEETKGNEGILIRVNRPFEEGELKGQYTEKTLSFSSRIPSMIRWAVPKDYLRVEEVSRNCYPYIKTEYMQPGMGENFKLTLESMHKPYPSGFSENELGLTEEELAKRKIIYLDILNGKPAPPAKWDLHNIDWEKVGLQAALEAPTGNYNPDAPPEWTQYYQGEMMIVTKVIKFNFQWYGLQTVVQNFALNTVFPNTFLDSHRALVTWGDHWRGMTIDDILRMEEDIVANQTFQLSD